MRPGGVQAFEYSDLRDELAWLVLRVISKLEPCTETSLVAYITGNYTPSHTPTRRFILNALAKLKALGLIQSAAGEIAITEVGRRFLDKLPIDASLRGPAGSRCMPALTSRPARAGSWNGCAAT